MSGTHKRLQTPVQKNPAPPVTGRRSLLSTTFLVLWLFAVVNGAFQQLQLWLTDSVTLPGYTVRILLIVPIVANVLIATSQRLSRVLRFFWLAAMVALSTSFLAVCASGKLQAGNQMVYFLTNYMLPLLAPMCLLSAPFIDLRKLARLLLPVTVVLSVLGIAQYFSVNPIVPTASDDGGLVITSWEFYGRVRAFSLFLSGLDFASLLALMVAFSSAVIFCKTRLPPGRVVSAILLCLCAVATYGTLTRNAYLFVIQSGLVAAYLTRRESISKRFWFLLPLVGAAIGFLAVVVVPGVISVVSNDLLSDDSLVERLVHWEHAMNVWTNSGQSVFLFGNGETQGAANAGYIVDNSFLNVAVQSGLVGLVSWVLYCYALWMELRHAVKAKASPMAVAICGFWSTWMLSGAFNVTNWIFALAIMPLFASSELVGHGSMRRDRQLPHARKLLTSPGRA